MRKSRWDPESGRYRLEDERKPLGLALVTFALIGLFCVAVTMIAVHTADLERQLAVSQQECQK